MVFYCFFNDTATTEISTLSLHDALPISLHNGLYPHRGQPDRTSLERPRSKLLIPLPLQSESASRAPALPLNARVDRKSTRLNSSHANISHAVFCLKKKRTKRIIILLLHI